jgi:hypothetical protein
MSFTCTVKSYLYHKVFYSVLSKWKLSDGGTIFWDMYSAVSAVP